jgi:hypothetical protein
MYNKIQMWPQFLFVHKLKSKPFLLTIDFWKSSPNGFNFVLSYMCISIVDLKIPSMDGDPSMVLESSSSLTIMTSKVLN